MIIVTTPKDVRRIFSEQEIATMKAFGDALIFEDYSMCEASIDDATHRTGEFFCTRTDKHPGLHVAMGIGVAAVWRK